MPPENKAVSELAKENGISEQTLYTWRRNLKSRGVPVPGNGKNAVKWSSADKFGGGNGNSTAERSRTC